MKVKKNIKIVIFAFFLLLLTIEVILRIYNGPVSQENLPSLFNYNYVDIHKKFFKKTFLSDGSIVYRSQREPRVSIEFPFYKHKDTKRIFILGGSAAFLTFKDELYINRILSDLFQGMNFEIVNCGMPRYDSYRILLALKEIINYKPDLIVVMSGNNEFHSPVSINIFNFRITHFLRKSWLFRTFHDEIKNGFFTKEKDSLKIFRKNLEEIIKIATKKKVPIFLCTIPVNLRDCPPEGIPNIENKEFFVSWNWFLNKEFEKATVGFKKFIVSKPEDPFAHYFLAKSHDSRKEYSKARDLYFQSLELDSDSGTRCKPSRNKVIHDLCDGKNVFLVDLEKSFIHRSSEGLLGADKFFDNCHWWSEYNYLAQEKIVENIITYNIIKGESAVEFTDKGRLNVFFKEYDSFKEPPLSTKDKAFEIAEIAFSQLFNKEVLYYDERAIAFITSSYLLDNEIFADLTNLKNKIYQDFSESFFAKDLLKEFGDLWPMFICYVGESFRRLDLPSESIRYFDKVIDLNPNLKLAYLSRGLSLYKMGRSEESKRDFNRVDEDSLYYKLLNNYMTVLKISN